MSLDDFLSKANQNLTVSKVHLGKVSEASHVANFIKDNSITESGNTKTVTPVYIYALYCEQGRPPIKRRRFTAYLKTFFKQYKSANKIFFRLDPKPFKMPENYSIFKELNQWHYKYQKTKFNNIKHTPEGWMIFLEVTTGRKIFGFDTKESKAAKLADKAAWFYYGPYYDKFNYPSLVKDLTPEDPELISLLQLKKADSHGPQKKETL